MSARKFLVWHSVHVDHLPFICIPHAFNVPQVIHLMFRTVLSVISTVLFVTHVHHLLTYWHITVFS